MSMLCTVGGCRRKQGIHVAHGSNTLVNFQNNHNKKWVLCSTNFAWAHLKSWTSHTKQGTKASQWSPRMLSKMAKIQLFIREFSNIEFSHAVPHSEDLISMVGMELRELEGEQWRSSGFLTGYSLHLRRGETRGGRRRWQLLRLLSRFMRWLCLMLFKHQMNHCERSLSCRFHLSLCFVLSLTSVYFSIYQIPKLPSCLCASQHAAVHAPVSTPRLGLRLSLPLESCSGSPCITWTFFLHDNMTDEKLSAGAAGGLNSLQAVTCSSGAPCEPQPPSLWLATGLAPARLAILVTAANRWWKWGMMRGFPIQLCKVK